MRRRWSMGRRAGAAAALLALAGCADLERAGNGVGWDPERIVAAPTPDDPFLADLRDGYLRLGRTELEEYDWNDGADFLAKAKAASDGTAPKPFALADRRVGSEALRIPLAAAEPELLALLGSPGGLLRAPREIARAQIDWECWLQEAQEGHEFEEIEACRAAFDESLAAAKEAAGLPKQLVVVLPEADGTIGGVVLSSEGRDDLLLDTPFAAGSADRGALPILEDEVRDVFADALDARPVPPSFFTILFDFESRRLDANAAAVVAEVLADIERRAAAEVVLIGHADAVGGERPNLRLSERRAAAVRTAIAEMLDAADPVSFAIDGVGATDLAVPTREPERRNRRVEITVR